MEEKFTQIGEKIRELRQLREMTQKELAGESVTRNMLSLIENGNALPSLTTLVYLAERLGVSVGYFFAKGEKEAAAFIKMSRIGEIREHFLNRSFEECLALCRLIPCPDEEIHLISAECSLALAAEAWWRFALNTAAVHLQNAKQSADKMPPSPATLSSTIRFMERFLQCVTAPALPDEILDAALYPESRIPAELFAYLRALHALDQGRKDEADGIMKSELIASPVYRDFLDAKSKMQQGQCAEAFPLLQGIPGAEDVGFFTTYRVLDALESCASTLGDFKNAYHYSTERIKLLEQFAK